MIDYSVGAFLFFSSHVEFCANNLWWVFDSAKLDKPNRCRQTLVALQTHAEKAEQTFPLFKNGLALVSDGVFDCFGNGELVFPSAHEAALNLEKYVRLKVLVATDGPAHMQVLLEEREDLGRIDAVPIDEDFIWPDARSTILSLPRLQFSHMTAAIERETAKMVERIRAVTSDYPRGFFNRERQTGIHDASAEARKHNTERREPSIEAIQCYRAYMATGRTQKELAQLLSQKLGRPITQGQVSKWLKQARGWLNAGNVLPELEVQRTQPDSMDPGVIDLGRRVDGHTQRQHQRRAPETDDR